MTIASHSFAADRPLTREVRFAVVLYGGISLAIYMNGISQEFLRMVRGSSDLPDGALDDVERIYRALSAAMPDNPTGRTQFLVDIISGTSAGGINGVALAKALVVGADSLDDLRRVWTDDANISRLFNDRDGAGWKTRARTQATRSLFDGDHMFSLLLTTLSAIKPGRYPGKHARIVDLFVTATDLEGRPVPIQLTGARLDERIHKAVFHFAHDGNRPDESDFAPENDPMLAFAARCTSSFPVAFPPMRFDDMPAHLRDYQRFAHFFPKGSAFADRQFADGGYLDNRPFSHATDLIPFRPTELPGERKLMYIDPFPEAPRDPKAARIAAEYDFLQNARLGAVSLPRYEIIRDDLGGINTLNRRLDRLSALQDRWREDSRRGLRPKQPGQPVGSDNLDLADFARLGYGDAYPQYHHLRVYGASDTLSAIVGRIAGFDPASDVTTYLRQIVRAWRDAHFTAYHTPGKETESAFLDRFDIDFRLRRLEHLRAEIDTKMDNVPPDLLTRARALIETELSGLRRLATRGIAATDVLGAHEVEMLTQMIEDQFDTVMLQPTFDARFAAAKGVYESPAIKATVDKAMFAIGERLQKAFSDSGARIRTWLVEERLIDSLEIFEGFHWHDVVTLPFLEGGGVAEHNEVQVFRISPADSSLNSDPNKLAGVAVGAFGGFLNRDWREHDILWGRLDGAERIVTALLPDDAHKDLRVQFIERLQDAIIRTEYGEDAGKGRREALFRAKLSGGNAGNASLDELARSALGIPEGPFLRRDRFKQFFVAVKPTGPNAHDVAGWTGRGLGILARMIDDLPRDGALRGASDRLAGGLRAGGMLTSRFVRFALPGSFRRMQADRWLFLAIIGGILLTILSALNTGLAGWIGPAVIIGASTIWTALYAFGRVLRGKTPLGLFARNLLLALAVALIGIGGLTSWQAVSNWIEAAR